jgi:uncharacterized protein
MTSTASTLLVFTLGPERESRARRLLPVPLAAHERELHRRGLDRALEAGRAAGCRVLVSSPAELELPVAVTALAQPAGSFGERLGAALDEAFARQGGPVVVVGTDVPELAPEHIRESLLWLGAGARRAVIGPSPDGGFYLLATSEPLTGLLARVRWRHRETRRDLERALEAAGFEVVHLAPLADLDHRPDLERWLAHAPRWVLADALWLALRRSLALLLAPSALEVAPPCPATRLAPLGPRPPPCLA